MQSFLRSLLDGLASVASWGQTDMARARTLAGLDDPRPGHVKDAEALRGDWEAVMGDRRRVEARRAASPIPARPKTKTRRDMPDS